MCERSGEYRELSVETRDGGLGGGVYCKTFSISVTGIAPSRRTFHSSPTSSTIVDGNDAPVSPPSSTSGKRLPSCFITWSAPEHDGNPETFALVPVIGPSNSSINCSTTALFGQRSATLPVLAVTLRGTRLDASITKVRPPGQNASANRRKFPGGVFAPAISPSRSRTSITACSRQFASILSARGYGLPFTR